MLMDLAVVWFWLFFFKQKTAYDMRISDWSSDVCSSDLHHHRQPLAHMTDDQLEAGMPIERAGEHEAQDVNRRLRVPAETRACEQETGVAGQIAIICVENRVRGEAGVQVERDIE